jgi:DHA1 family multidrug resistance protein-like MFS transporter
MPLFIQSLLPTAAGVSTFTGVVVGLASAATTASAIYLGRLGDRVGHRRIVIVSAFAAAVFYVPQIFVTETWQLLLLQILAGASMGGLLSSPSALLASYTDPGDEGAVYGLDSSIVSGARALAPLLASSIAVWFGLRGSFAATSIILIVVLLLAVRGLPEVARERQLKAV